MIFGIFGIMALLSISLVAAYQGNHLIKGPNSSEERHDAMENAFDNLDYDAWVALMTENGRHPKVLDIITEETFATFVEAHDAMEDGDFDRAAELRADLGLNNGMGSKNRIGSEERRDLEQGSKMKGQYACHNLK